MKKRILLIALLGIFLASCKTNSLPYNPNDISMIVIGAETKGKSKNIVTIQNREGISKFFDGFKFGGERKYTLKHKLPAFIIVYLSNGKSAELRFEKKLMRFNGKEYVLSEDTESSLEKIVKNLSNKAL